MDAQDSHKKAVLYFSINKETLGIEFVRSSIKEYTRITPHPHRVIVIADTIKSRSFEIIDRKKRDKARMKCLELGDIILNNINQVCDELKIEKIKVFRWEDLIKDPQYSQHYEQAARQLEVRIDLKKMLEELAMVFLNKRDAERPWKREDIDVSVDFFVQEIPSFRRVRFQDVEIDRVYYTPQKIKFAEVIYDVLRRVGDGLTGMGEPVPHELIRVQCINQE